MQAPKHSVAASFKGLLRRSDLIQSKGYIGGRWIDAISGRKYTIEDPSLGVSLGSVAAMDNEDAENAIAAAKDAFFPWRDVTPNQRSAILNTWGRLLRDNQMDLGMIMSKESGKILSEAVGEVHYAADYLEFFAHEVLRADGFMVPSHLRGRRLMALRQPVGVCAMITPWNFPLGMLARKVSPALATGCTAIVKPAEDTPLSALAFAKLGEEAGIPAGVINIVTGPREAAADIGRTLSTHNDVRKLSFTGSTLVGKLLAADCASTVKRVSLELGGNAPFIVFEDADINLAVDELVRAKFRNTGQTCVSPNRIFVQESIFDIFAEKLKQRVSGLKIGRAQDVGIHLGPLIRPSQVIKMVDSAIADGATFLCRGGPVPRLGLHYMSPVVLKNVSTEMQIAKEECFGPVLSLLSFRTEVDVVSKANATRAGLAAYCFTKDLGRAWRLSEQLEAGMVGINASLLSTVQAPFGGVKESGLGREGSIVGLDDYTQLKYVCMASLS